MKGRNFIKRIRKGGALGCLALASAWLAALVLIFNPAHVSASAPGGIFVTGHDSDYHAQDASGRSNPTGAQHIIQRAIAYVTYGNPKPRILLVAEGGLKCISCSGLRAAGFPSFAVADFGSNTQGILDLHSVQFGDYDVVVISSNIGPDLNGSLRQAEVDILNSRSGDLLSYVNDGGGLVVFAEDDRLQGRFGFLPFLRISDIAQRQTESQNSVSPLGSEIGLTDDDVNGNISHNYFTASGNMQVIDIDPQGRALSLAVRGSLIGQNGVAPTDTPVPPPPTTTPAAPALPSAPTILAVIVWLAGTLLFEGAVVAFALNLIRRTPQAARGRSGQDRSTVKALGHRDVGTLAVEPSSQLRKPAIRISSNQGDTIYSIDRKDRERKPGA
ncbi:MAG TPA: hypothetical protein VLZ89_01500 [Anaerolineales bacterium]|nr:hypothetical protein [Anaerolineales bacterium]